MTNATTVTMAPKVTWACNKQGCWILDKQGNKVKPNSVQRMFHNCKAEEGGYRG